VNNLKAIYIYNPYSAQEVTLIERAKSEMSTHVEELEVIDFESAKNRFKIRATPALIVIRDDLQGEILLNEVNGKLRVTAELYKMLEEEERNIHQAEMHRIDNLIIREVQKGQDDLLEDMLSRGVL
jgi:hypothetical protein